MSGDNVEVMNKKALKRISKELLLEIEDDIQETACNMVYDGLQSFVKTKPYTNLTESEKLEIITLTFASLSVNGKLA